MSGDWIKMRVNLVAHPKVIRLAELLLGDARFVQWSALSFGLGSCPSPSPDEERDERHAALRVTRYVCVTSLLRFWGYANEHAKGEHIESLTVHDVDEIVGVPGFGASIAAVGWAEFGPNGGVVLPGFSEHNTSAEVRKSGSAERQKAYRERLKLKAESDVTRYVTSQPREEKRREEKKETSATNDNRVVFDATTGHFSIPELLSEQWKAAYPAVGMDIELSKASAWLIANPKNAKSNYARFLTNWLTKSQDKAPRVASVQNLFSGAR